MNNRLFKTIYRIIPEEYRILILEIVAVILFFFTCSTTPLLYHTVLGVLGLFITYSLFLLVFNTRHLSSQPFLFFLSATAMVYVGIDFLRLFLFWNNPFFSQNTVNLIIQFWIIARFVESGGFIGGLFFWFKKIRFLFLWLAYLGVTIFLVLSTVVWNIFPVVYYRGIGLTPFAIVSEYIIAALFYVTVSVLLFNSQKMNSRVLRNLLLAMILNIGSEMIFTLFRSSYGFMIELRILVKFISLLFFYQSAIQCAQVQSGWILFWKLPAGDDETCLKSRERIDILDLGRER